MWEALLTLAFFPITVGSAYITDRFSHIYDYVNKTYRMGRKGVIVETTTDKIGEDFYFKHFPEEIESQEVKQFEDQRREFIMNLKNLRKLHPTMDSNQLELMASAQLFDKGTTSRAFLRMETSKKLTGFSSTRVRQASRRTDFQNGFADQQITPTLSARNWRVTKVYFCKGHYTVTENVGRFSAVVLRENGDLNRKVLVDYATEDAGAKSGKDYISVSGTLFFQPGETRKEIEIQIIDNLVYEGDQHFCIRLFNLRFAEGKQLVITSKDAYCTTPIVTRAKLNSTIPIVNEEQMASNTIIARFNEESESNKEILLRLACPSLATVLILDDDHHGIFSLVESEVSIRETAGMYNFQIIRSGGSRGRVALPYRTEEGTAKEGRDYQHSEGVLIFEEGDVE